MKLIIYTDGASRGNPGPSSYGFLIRNKDGKMLYKKGEYIGITTNNVAEYSAVLNALKYVVTNFKNDDLEVDFFMDSKLVVEQLSGRFRIKSPHLLPLVFEIKKLSNSIAKISFTHVLRGLNKDADLLANQALDAR